MGRPSCATSRLIQLRKGYASFTTLPALEHNLRARAFYRKAGFTEVGEHSFMLGEDRQRDIIMVRPVAVDAAGSSPSG